MQDQQRLPEPPVVSSASPQLMLAVLILSIVVVLALVLFGIFSKKLSAGWRIFVFGIAAVVVYLAATSGPGLLALYLIAFTFAD